MNQKFTRILLFCCCALMLGTPAFAQLSGTVAVPSLLYPDLNTVFTLLNAQGVGAGGVVINVTAAQTAPASGYQLGSSTLNPTVSATTPIKINGNGNTITAPLANSTNTDGIMFLKGIDYVKISNFRFVESSSNTVDGISYGIAFFKLNARAPYDGCQYDTVQNCTFSLKSTIGSAGIEFAHLAIPTTPAPATTSVTASDLHSNNAILQDSFLNCAYGINFEGKSGVVDQNNKIYNCKFILNGYNYYSYGVHGNYYRNLTIVNNDFLLPTNIAAYGTYAIGLYAYGYGSLNITNNRFNNTTNSALNYEGINVASYDDRAGVINIQDNTLTGTNTIGGSLSLYFVDLSYNTVSRTNVERNTIQNLTWKSAGAMRAFYADNYVSDSVFFIDNTIRKYTNATATPGLDRFFHASNTSAGRYVFQNNKIRGIRTNSSCYGFEVAGDRSRRLVATGNLIDSVDMTNPNTSFYNIFGSAGSGEIANDTISNVRASNEVVNYLSYDVSGLSIHDNYLHDLFSDTGRVVNYFDSAGENNLVYSNMVSNLSTRKGTVRAFCASGDNGNIYKNYISQLSVTGNSGMLTGMLIQAPGRPITVYNNVITGFSVPATYNGPRGLNGLIVNGTGTARIYYNTVYMSLSVAATAVGATGVSYTANVGMLDLRNNIIHVNVPPTGTGITMALRRRDGVTGDAPANYANTSNANIFYTPSGARTYFYGEDSANTVINGYSLSNDPNFNQPCSNYKLFMLPRDAASFTENNLTVSGSVMTPTGVTYAKNGAVPTTPPVTEDYAGTARPAIADMGAFQFSGTGLDGSAPVILIRDVNPKSFCNSSLRIVATITDVSGVDSDAYAPRLYYKKRIEQDAFVSANQPSANGWKYVSGVKSGNDFTFTMNYALLTAPVVANDTIDYFIIAQDLQPGAKVGYNLAGLALGYCPTSVNLPGNAGPTRAKPAKRYIYIVAPPPGATVTPANSTACEGSAVQLTAHPYITTSVDTVGRGNLINFGTSFPTPLGRYYGSSHSQYLISAAELTASGMRAGRVTSLGFNMFAASVDSFKDFRVQLGNTTVSDLTSTLESSGLTTVYTSPMYQAPGNGWQDISFSTPFFWDGASNIVVDVAFLNCTVCNGSSSCNTVYTTNRIVRQTATAYVSSHTVYADGNCTIPSYTPSGTFSDLLHNQRPNMRFTNGETYDVNWQPYANLYKDAMLTVPLNAADTFQTVYAAPPTTTAYTVANVYEGCTGTPSAPARVNITPGPNVTMTPAAGTSGICANNGNVPISVPAAPNQTYQWYKNNVAISGATQSSYTATGPGRYRVFVSNSSTGCSRYSPTDTLVIVAPPPAVATNNGSTTFCSGSSVVLNANFGTTYSYQWLRNGNAIAGATNPSYNATQSGNYAVRVNETGCPGVSNTIPVTVNTTPSNVSLYSSPIFCNGDSVLLHAPHPATGTVYTYQWKKDGNDVNGATDSVLSSSVSGVYTVVVTNTTTGCASITQSPVTITAGSPPPSFITPSNNISICQGLSTLLSTNTSPGLYYQWFRNGTAIPGADSSTYPVTSGGNYTVQVSINANCNSTTQNPVMAVVQPRPVAQVNSAGGSSSFCSGSSLQLSGTGGAYGYQWLYNQNIAAFPSNNATYQANDSGQYILVVSDLGTGCADTSAPFHVGIDALPPASYTAAGPLQICSGDTLVLTGNQDTGISYRWKLNGNPAPGNATSPTYGAYTSGYYSLQVIDNRTGCSSSTASSLVDVRPTPPAQITPAGTVHVCAGNTVTIYAGSGFSYQWMLNGNNVTVNPADNFFVAGNPGRYAVLVTDSSSGCAARSDTLIVDYVPLPTVNINPMGTLEACDSALLSVNNNAAYNYIWLRNNAPVPGALSPTLHTGLSGTYLAVATDVYGCRQSSTPVNVIVHPIPPSAITYSGGLAFCEGGAVALSCYAGYRLRYRWVRNGNLLTDSITTYVATTGGTYQVYTTDTFGCTAKSLPVNVTVFPAPQATITQNGLRLSASGFASYQWFMNGVPVSGATGPDYQVTQDGVYYVSVVDANGCTTQSQAVSVINTKVADTDPLSQRIRVFPNPTSGIAFVEAPFPVNATVRDAQGRTVLVAPSARQVDLTQFAGGVYTVTVEDQDGHALKTVKLVKMQ